MSSDYYAFIAGEIDEAEIDVTYPCCYHCGDCGCEHIDPCVQCQ